MRLRIQLYDGVAINVRTIRREQNHCSYHLTPRIGLTPRMP